MNLDSIIKALVIVIIVLLICSLLLLGAWGVVALVTDSPLFGSSRPAQPDGPTEQTQSQTQAKTGLTLFAHAKTWIFVLLSCKKT